MKTLAFVLILLGLAANGCRGAHAGSNVDPASKIVCEWSQSYEACFCHYTSYLEIAKVISITYAPREVCAHARDNKKKP